MSTELPALPQAVSDAALAAIEESRAEMLRRAARMLLEWKRPLAEIVEMTGLPQKEIEEMRG